MIYNNDYKNKLNPNYLPNGETYKDLGIICNITNLPEHVKIGQYTYYHSLTGAENFVRDCVFYATPNDKLIIGKFCSLAWKIKFIFNAAHHFSELFTTYPFFLFDPKVYQDCIVKQGIKEINKGDIIIGNDVWIGYDATIMPGVKIGNGAIIGTKALVTKDVAPYSVVGGNPAKHIKFRFSESQIAKLNEMQWWDWDYQKIIEAYGTVGLNEIDKLYDFYLSNIKNNKI